MWTKTRVALDGVWLHEMDEKIAVQRITEGSDGGQRQTVQRGSGIGSVCMARTRPYLEVRVDFSVFRQDMAERREIIDRIRAWCDGGGVMTVSYRDGQALDVVCESLPDVGDMTDWTKDLSVTFRAYGVPYWHDEVPTVMNQTTIGAAKVNIEAGGNTKTPLEFEMTAKAATDTVTISANGRTMTFSGLGMVAGEKLILRYREGLQEIVKLSGGVETSVLSKRSVKSDDDLWLMPGTNVISVNTVNKAGWEMRCTGRYV